jgi:hypothetical protein
VIFDVVVQWIMCTQILGYILICFTFGTARLEKGVIVYITDSMGVRDIYEADGNGAISTNEPLVVLVSA